jgi:hypothetical protein
VAPPSQRRRHPDVSGGLNIETGACRIVWSAGRR